MKMYPRAQYFVIENKRFDKLTISEVEYNCSMLLTDVRQELTKVILILVSSFLFIKGGTVMFWKKKSKNYEVRSVVDGVIIDLSQVKDNVFAKEQIGKGIAISPKSGKIYSPVDGMLTSVFPTGHAYGITGDDGVELLIHIGVDTVKLKGEGFKVQSKQGTQIKKGDLLVECDFEFIEQQGYSTDTLVFVLNPQAYTIIERCASKTQVHHTESVLMTYKKADE